MHSKNKDILKWKIQKGILFFLVFLSAILLTSCREENQKQDKIAVYNCTDCHKMQIDNNHHLPCVKCHKGTPDATGKDSAHKLLIAQPADPSHVKDTCGSCHAKESSAVSDSLHYTLKKSTNMFRKAFGAQKTVDTFQNTPEPSKIHTVLDLADDLLRRRCFNCHPFNHGDNFPLTSHGTGCASCHLSYKEGSLQSHKFTRPEDKECLSCHYGNYVGFDYYGRFEQDLNDEYRTPYTTKNDYFRPYGVEYHQLTPDIHQQKGLWCIDCHLGEELMNTGNHKPSCKGCHLKQELLLSLPKHVEKQGNHFIFHGADGKEHPLPLLHHPAHFAYRQKISCQTCHAQWTFNDTGKHYIRLDNDDLDAWTSLTTQGNSEVQTILKNNTDFDNTEIPTRMSDKINNKMKDGIWLKGYSQRRWEEILLGRDKNGVITPIRPMLDFFLSWVDVDDTVRFDSTPSRAENNGYLPYVPHTTGPAGIFYRQRIEQFLKSEKSTSTK